MPKEINCEKVKENINKLKILKNEFLVEMEKIKKDGIAGNIFELKKEVEEIKGFLDEELKEYLLTEEEKKEREEKLNQELKKYLIRGYPDYRVDLTNASQKEIKDKIINFKKGSIEDSSNNIFYPNLQKVAGWIDVHSATIFLANSLQTVGGDLDVPSVTIFLANSLQTVGGDLYSQSATEFSANSLQIATNVYAEKATIFLAKFLRVRYNIHLTKSNFQKFFDEDGKFNWDQAEKEGKLILPKETRKKVEWQ